jgi:hypothetical protein
MKKLQNASNNLEEILAAVVAGKEVEFYSERVCGWLKLNNTSFALNKEGLCLEWRVKPDDVEIAWDKETDGCLMGSNATELKLAGDYFRKGWNAAIKQMERKQ